MGARGSAAPPSTSFPTPRLPPATTPGTLFTALTVRAITANQEGMDKVDLPKLMMAREEETSAVGEGHETKTELPEFPQTPSP